MEIDVSDHLRRKVLDSISSLRPDLAAEINALSGDTDLLAAGILDSISFMQLLLLLEQERGSELDLAEIEAASLTRLQTLAKLIE